MIGRSQRLLRQPPAVRTGGEHPRAYSVMGLTSSHCHGFRETTTARATAPSDSAIGSGPDDMRARRTDLPPTARPWMLPVALRQLHQVAGEPVGLAE